MKKWLFDFILGAVMLVVSVAMLIYSYFLDSGWMDTYFLARADVYVALWVGLLAILSLMLMIRALCQRRTEAGQRRLQPIWSSTAVWTVVILGLYLLLLNKLGFILDSIWMLWAMTFLYTLKSKGIKLNRDSMKLVGKELLKTLCFSVVCSLLVYWVFTQLLSSKLPTFDLF